MRRLRTHAAWALALVLAAGRCPALAQDVEAAPELVTTAAADGAPDPLPGEPAPVVPSAVDAVPAEPLWTLAASAGISARDDGPDGSWQSLSLTRRIGRGYVRGSFMRYNGTLTQADLALPSDYYVGTIGAGGNFDNWVVDGWASYGRQDYGRISTSLGSRSSTGAKGSNYYALGGDFGRVTPLGSAFYLTSTVAGSFAYGKLLRPRPIFLDLPDLETSEPTWSANATLRIDHAFGASGNHYAGLSISRNWTSNGVSALSLRSTGEGYVLDSKHYADGWSEAGATASMRLGRNLYLDLFATRSIGMKAGNVTAAGATLRKSF